MEIQPHFPGFYELFSYSPCKGYNLAVLASDKVYQLLAHGWWFSPGTPASSTTITGRHDIAEILLKVALKHQKSNLNLTIYQMKSIDQYI
jgi:hypothetical protein